MRRLIAGIIFIACAVGLVGCETMKGAGEDMEHAGHEIQEKAS